MPLMMNDDMDIDINDLFGDETVLSLPSRPPPRELFQRVDELRGSGCCQYDAFESSFEFASVAYFQPEESHGQNLVALLQSPRMETI
jgi:mediator of RNA polymerase II transcription subunit 16